MINLEKQSKTSAGRQKIVKELTERAVNSYLRSRDDECWEMFNNTGDEEEFTFLTQVGEFSLPAKIRRIPIQRSKANILLSQQSLRNPRFGMRMVDRDGIKGKLTRLYKSMMMMYTAALNDKYLQIQFQIDQLNQQVAQMEQYLQEDAQGDPEIQQQQAKIQEVLPTIKYQIQSVVDNLSVALKMTKDERVKFEEKLKNDYEDLYEIYAKKLLVKIREEMDAKSVSLENMRNKVVVGREYYYTNFSHQLQDLEYNAVNPYRLYYPNIESIKWTQNLPWIVVESHMTKEQILNNWKLTPTEQKKLDAMSFSQTAEQGAFVTGPGQVVVLDNQKSDTGSRKYNITGEGIRVRQLWWRADDKFSALQSPNKYQPGSKFTMFVNDKTLVDTQEYKFDNKKQEYVHKQTGERISKEEASTFNSKKGQTKETRFFDKRYWGVNIGDVLILEGEDPVQPHPQDNYDYTPLPIVGKTYNGIGEFPYSIIWATTELQKQYWIVSYHRELTFALAGASGVVFDLSQKPDGMTKEEWFYHMKLGRYLIQTMTKTGGRKNTGYNQFSRVDQTLTASIQYFELILQGIEQQIGTVMGIPRQRQGEVVPTDQVGTFDQSNRQAALVTEIMFTEHDEVEVKAQEMLLNLAIQYKYKPDELIDVTEEEVDLIRIPWDMNNRKFRMKLLNSSKQDMDLDEMKRMSAQMAASGGIPFDFLFKIFSIDSIKEMENLVSIQMDKQAEIAELQAQGTVEAEAQAKRVQTEMEQNFEAQMKAMQLKLEQSQMQINKYLKERELDIKEKQVDASIQAEETEGALQAQKDGIQLMQEDRKQTEVERKNRTDEILKRSELQLEALLKTTGLSRGIDVG